MLSSNAFFANANACNYNILKEFKVSVNEGHGRKGDKTMS